MMSRLSFTLVVAFSSTALPALAATVDIPLVTSNGPQQIFGQGTVSGTTVVWPLETPWDGTNQITIKAASTPAASGDTALVIGLSPNSLLPGFASTPTVAIQPGGTSGKVLANLGSSVQQIKATAGTYQFAHCDNGNSATVYLEIFNTSSVTLGTTAPSWIVPVESGGSGEALPAGINLGGSAIYAAAVTSYNGSSAPSPLLNCSIGYM